MERRHVEDWDTNKLELLAQEYMACRQEMWRVLAERLGEKWHVVETKVCISIRLKSSACANSELVHGERL